MGEHIEKQLDLGQKSQAEIHTQRERVSGASLTRRKPVKR